jgi:hypothetical protein
LECVTDASETRATDVMADASGVSIVNEEDPYGTTAGALVRVGLEPLNR